MFLEFLYILSCCKKIMFINSLRPGDAISKLTSIGSGNVLLPGRHQAIIWTNAGICLTGPLGKNFNEILIKIRNFHSRKCIWKYRLKNAAILSRPQYVNFHYWHTVQTTTKYDKMWILYIFPGLYCNVLQAGIVIMEPEVEQAPVPLSIFRSNSKFDENSKHSSVKYTRPITTIFCTRHDSVTVVTCAKNRCDRSSIFETRAFWIFTKYV